MRTKAGTNATDKTSFEHVIDGIQVMIAILTGSIVDGEAQSDYFNSRPCQFELSRAQENGIPVLFVLESARVGLQTVRICVLDSTTCVASFSSVLPVRTQPIYSTAVFRSTRIGVHARRISFPCSTGHQSSSGIECKRTRM